MAWYGKDTLPTLYPNNPPPYTQDREYYPTLHIPG